MLVRIRDADVLINMLARPLVDAEGRPRGAVVMLEDVTERRRDEAQLRSAYVAARRPRP